MFFNKQKPNCFVVCSVKTVSLLMRRMEKDYRYLLMTDKKNRNPLINKV